MTRATRLVRLLVVASIVSLLSLIVSACGSSTGHAGDTLRMGEADAPLATINYFNVTQFQEFDAIQAIYPALVNYDSHGKLVGDWARSWSFARDGHSVTFHLRADTKWSDGVPMTSADAVWMCNATVKYANGGTVLIAWTLPSVTSCSAPNPTTVVIHMSKPRAAALMPSLPDWFILPKHVWAPHTGPNGNGLKTYQPKLPLVAGGPYTITSWKSSGTTIFARNPSYYGPRPYAKNIAWEFFSNADAMVAALQSNQLDVAYDIPAHAISALRSNSSLTLSGQSGVTLNALGVNQSKTQTHRELLDPRVRHAFSLAVNRRQLIDIAYAGYAQPLGGPLPTLLKPWRTGSAPDPYDLAKANDLLNGLGYTRGSGGVRVANGHKMSYTMLVEKSLPLYNRMASIVSAGLGQIGVRVKQVPVDQVTFTKMAAGPRYTGFDLNLWYAVGFPDPDLNLAFASCSLIGSYNYTGYCNARYDALVKQEQALPGTANRAKRLAVVHKAQGLFEQELPFIPILSPDYVGAHRKSWTGFNGVFAGFDMATTKRVFTGPRRSS
jgi:peptide/nickel transport system substrate-binding protein